MALRYLLDTNVLSEPLRPVPDASVMSRIAAAGDALATAAPVWHELQYGCFRLPVGRRRKAIETLLDAMAGALAILPYDAACAAWHARERARLTRLGRPAPFVDGQIAAVAAVNRLVLVTRNGRDFTGFANLTVESWFAA